MGDVFVRVQDLPIGINGMTILDSEGDYNVYINARLSHDGQVKAYDHEMTHIQRDDFYNDLPIWQVEEI